MKKIISVSGIKRNFRQIAQNPDFHHNHHPCIRKYRKFNFEDNFFLAKSQAILIKMDSKMAAISLGAAAGILTASRIFGLDFDLFSPDEPAIEENPTMPDNLWNKPMMLVGLGLAGIAMIATAGIACWKMFAPNDEISNEEPLIETEPRTIALRNRNVNRR